MLAYSDNYKHNDLIYSQVVIIDVTTNGATTLANPEASKTCKKQGCVQGLLTSLPPSLPLTPTQVFQGLYGKQSKLVCPTQIIRKQNAYQPRILDFSVKMAVPPGGKDDLVRRCKRFLSKSLLVLF